LELSTKTGSAPRIGVIRSTTPGYSPCIAFKEVRRESPFIAAFIHSSSGVDFGSDHGAGTVCGKREYERLPREMGGAARNI
jgi:hypothetical protein